METLRLLSTTQQVDPALFGEEYSDYIDVKVRLRITQPYSQNQRDYTLSMPIQQR